MPQEQETGRATHPLEALTFGERLVLAVLEHRVVRIQYQGHDRIIEPQLIGIHEAGEPMLVAYQTGGTSRHGRVPGWRTFITTSVEAVEPTDEHFAGPRGDFDFGAHRMIEVFARA
ncbi:MAG: WYL domain-containing protein [Gemmatimonadales bacterium]